MSGERFLFPIVRQVAKRDWLSAPLDRVLAPLNPLDARRYADPYVVYEEARLRAGPFFLHRRLRTYTALGYEACEQVLRGPVSVERGHLIEAVRPYSRLTERSRSLVLSSMLMRDPPDHTRLRKLVNRAFTPRAITAMEPVVESIAAELLSDVRGTGRFDVMDQFASRLPVYAISDMLGFPRSDRDVLKQLSDVIAQFVDPLTGFDPAEMDAAIDEFVARTDVLIDARRREPQADMVSALAAVEAEGDRLDRRELTAMVLLLMLAGHETTTNLIGNALVALDEHRDARTLLLDRPDLAENAVEELLRFDTPVQVTDRTALEDFTVGGVRIPAGATIVAIIGAANRDPDHYDAPDELRLDRPEPRPLSFGHGVHHCLGAGLARLEAKVAIPAFIGAFPDYRVDGQSLHWNRSVTLRGPSRLVVTSAATVLSQKGGAGSVG